MARIRSVKPEFWTSEQIAECSPNARLMFIGMWSFCDDYGVHPASCARLKMEVFPADSISSSDVRRMIDELLSNRLIQEYEIAGTKYWWVTGWDKHQKPDCKTGRHPLPNGEIGGKIRRQHAEDSSNVLRTFADHSPMEKEKEKEKEKVIRAPRKEPIPENFSVSESVQAWAEKNGYDQLDKHLNHFINAAKAKGYSFADWDRAFMNAISGNWAKVVVSASEQDWSKAPIFAGGI